MLRSSHEFLEKLQEINLNSNQVMVSFDVKSLFTNVPLQKTIELFSNKIYDKNSNANHLPIKKKIFKKLLKLETKRIFLYKDKLYQQIDGVSMGSPLGLTIATVTTFWLKRKPAFYNSNSIPAKKSISDM